MASDLTDRIRKIVANAIGYVIYDDGRPRIDLDGTTGIEVTDEETTRCLAAADRVLAHLVAEATATGGDPKLLPAESMALTVGLAQVLRGETPSDHVAAMCVLALARLAGRHDWTEEADRG